MKKLLASVLLAGLVLWLLTRPNPLSPGVLPEHQADSANGELLFYAGGCDACHGTDLGGGLEMNSAFGTFRAPNISADATRGIGGWSDLDFINAMKKGVAPDGRHYYPAFPYTSYARMSLEDLVDLKAYIDSLAGVSNTVGDHELRFPWNFRRAVGLWKLRYLDPEPVVVIEVADTAVARGRYLVEGPGHCAECHTPRDALGGLRTARWLAGGPHPDGEGSVPNITPHRDGLASWSEKDITGYLKTGFTPDFDMVGGSMVTVQEHLANLPERDLAAVAAYLKRIPARPSARN
jgi:mono/diheme cytochrome c family protein